MTTALTLSLTDIEAQPGLLLDLFRKAKDIRFIIDPVDSEHVTVYRERKYSEEAIQIVREARAEYLALKASGQYSREQAVEDFTSAWNAIQQKVAEHHAE